MRIYLLIVYSGTFICGLKWVSTFLNVLLVLRSCETVLKLRGLLLDAETAWRVSGVLTN